MNLNHIAQTPRRLWNWTTRFRHRCGYGIHSPFAFNFVTDTIYNRGTYYAYARLRPLCAEKFHRLRWKDCKLIFRLANFQRPQQAAAVAFRSESERNACLSIIAQGSTQMQPTPHPTQADLIIAGEQWPAAATELVSSLKAGAMLIVTGIGKRNRAAWQQILQSPNAQVTFDLRDFGIVFNRPELNRQHYIVNYL